MPRPRTAKPRSRRHAALGQAIESVIAEKTGMTQEKIAEDSGGLTVEQVGSYVRGLGNPTYTTLLKLCKGLHVSLGELMSRADELYEQASRAGDAPI
jgi:transcriptional regulator with XRE-family HTH domain